MNERHYLNKMLKRRNLTVLWGPPDVGPAGHPAGGLAFVARQECAMTPWTLPFEGLPDDMQSRVLGVQISPRRHCCITVFQVYGFAGARTDGGCVSQRNDDLLAWIMAYAQGVEGPCIIGGAFNSDAWSRLVFGVWVCGGSALVAAI